MKKETLEEMLFTKGINVKTMNLVDDLLKLRCYDMDVRLIDNGQGYNAVVVLNKEYSQEELSKFLESENISGNVQKIKDGYVLSANNMGIVFKYS